MSRYGVNAGSAPNSDLLVELLASVLPPKTLDAAVFCPDAASEIPAPLGFPRASTLMGYEPRITSIVILGLTVTLYTKVKAKALGILK